ncbi:uncharacterized protein [Euphorbia lathyris]|uniref:uncharacterized protein n=1 Tax=Euphorbia lathyris TaxID=212925 RepID=UPI003314413E
MCPLRFILVFFSAVLAGYFAWRSVRSSPELDSSSVSDDSAVDKKPLTDNQDCNAKKMVQSGFWVFVDMASGKYLWRNFKEMRKQEKVKT